jgi:precorrin-2 dehydrogenase/sirohydrochlorin ferrochelatase
MAYPIFVKLEGRRCIVVGAGRVAERRIEALLRQHAQVLVVAPQASTIIKDLARTGRLSWAPVPYETPYLEGAFLVFAATSDHDTNAAVCRDALERNILVSRADYPDDGSFHAAAMVERGDLILAITTNGNSPTLSAVVRDRIEQQYPQEWSVWTQLFGRLRHQIQQISSEKGRKRAANTILDNAIVSNHVADGNVDAAEKEAKRCISSLPA